MQNWMYTINETIILLNRFLLESKKDVEDLNKLNIAAHNIMEVLKDKNYQNTSLGLIELYLELEKASKENKRLHDVIYEFRLFDTNETIVVDCALGPVSCSEFDETIYTETKAMTVSRLKIRSHISNILLDSLYIPHQRIKEIDDKRLDEFIDTIERSIMKRLKSELGELLRKKINKALPKSITQGR